MMYERDIVVIIQSVAKLPEQELDDGREERIDPEEEDGEHGRHDQHHDRGGDGFLARRPDDLGRFRADLTDELAGGSFRHWAWCPSKAKKRRSAGAPQDLICGVPYREPRLLSSAALRLRLGPCVGPPRSFGRGRGRGTRTHDPRFWRPMLYQLSYAPVPPAR